VTILDLAYRLYAQRLRAQQALGPVPRHVGLIMDGNRRWAREMGFDNPSLGHEYGARHIEEVIGWCADAGVSYVTIYVASTENLTARPSAEMQFLMQVVEHVIAKQLTRESSKWQVRIAGLLDLLPDSTAHALKQAEEATRDRDANAHLTIAVGYGGRQEVVDALRSLLDEEARAGTTLLQLAEKITVDDIAAHLYTAGQPDPDLVIRTSGEQRLSGFLLWQSVDSELYFCDAYWPAFRQIDFLRALRSYANRKRQSGAEDS
jgi:short-chain Z-isoprenyl diphosphate synthase